MRKSKPVMIDMETLRDLGIAFRDPNMKLPTMSAEEFYLDDEDERICRKVSKEELRLSHVDSNIESVGALQADPWTLSADSIDRQFIKVTYLDGREASLRLGEISKDRGEFTKTYKKFSGVSVPVDDDGALLMNGENTPILSNLRSTFHAALRTESKERLEVISVGAAFGAIIGRNGGMGSGEALDEVITVFEENAF